jgi:hypothetical protein
MSPNRLGVPKGGDVMLSWSASYRTLLARLKAFNENEEGAITVEWVVITAGICTFAMSMYMVFKIDPQEAVTDDLSYVIMSNMQIDNNPQNREGMGPLDKLLEVIRYKTTALRGCLGFKITSGAGDLDDSQMREGMCALL